MTHLQNCDSLCMNLLQWQTKNPATLKKIQKWDHSDYARNTHETMNSTTTIHDPLMEEGDLDEKHIRTTLG